MQKNKLILAVILFTLLAGCIKNDESLSLRKILFGANADSLTMAVTSYNYFGTGARESYFSDDFSANTNNWPVYNQFTNANNYTGFGLIQDGEYYISGDGCCNPQYFYINKIIDTARNFEVICRVKHFEAFGGNLFSRQGLFFRGGFDFSKLTAAGLFLKAGNGTENSFSVRNIISDETFGSEYPAPAAADGYNTLVFRKVRNQYSAFVNQRLIVSGPFSDVKPGRSLLGFVALDRMKVDYLKIDYLTF